MTVLTATEIATIDNFVGTQYSNATDMEAATPPDQATRIAWLKALAAAIAAHQG